MANVIIRDAARRERAEKILRDFGKAGLTATKHAKECAEHIAQKCREIEKARNAK